MERAFLEGRLLLQREFVQDYYFLKQRSRSQLVALPACLWGCLVSVAKLNLVVAVSPSVKTLQIMSWLLCLGACQIVIDEFCRCHSGKQSLHGLYITSFRESFDSCSFYICLFFCSFLPTE